jgi:hypothetical protein
MQPPLPTTDIEQATPMANCRLIYRSICSSSFLPNDDLRALVQQSAENNRDEGITGLLLLSGDRFLQVLEGPSLQVNRLFTRIMRDTRHHDVELISFEQIGPTYFDDWNMYLVDLFDLSKQPRELLARKYTAANGVIEIPERLHEVYALLLDARAICRGRPWDECMSSGGGDQTQPASAAPQSSAEQPLPAGDHA